MHVDVDSMEQVLQCSAEIRCTISVGRQQLYIQQPFIVITTT